MTTTPVLPAGLDLADVDAAAEELATRLPANLRPLARVAHNQRWSWHPDGPATFAALDPDAWAAADHNPVRLLARLPHSRLERLGQDERVGARTARLAADLDADLGRPFREGLDPERPVAFLCAEFGLHESLPQYSGGLGVLAGDIVKAASDLALPMVGVGLFYKYGYFQQRLDNTGWQHESWVAQDPSRMPVVPVSTKGARPGDNGADGGPDASGRVLPDDQLHVTVPVRGREITARVWRLQVGRVPLFLLDTDIDGNSPEDRWTTARLYDANPDIRLAQYATLGIGAVRVLDALGISPGTIHMNEGHAALAALELASQQVARGTSFWDAREDVRERCVFTTHTPVAAGNETYPPQTVLSALPGMAERLGLSNDELLDLGRVEPGGQHEAGMTPIALRMSRSTNGVSARHGEVARSMWQPLFGGAVEEVPITSVTNGVHVPTWTSPHFRRLFDQHLPEDWVDRCSQPEVWEAVGDIPADQLWAARSAARAELVDWVRERSAFDRLRRGESLEYAQAAHRSLDPDMLTLGFARRVASYKRLHLLTRDVDRVIGMLDSDQSFQLLIAGKAHPKDDGAKSMVRDLFTYRGNAEIASRIVFLEDYDIEVGRLLTSGCDVWLNVPRPPMEASGTSGMKCVLNGGLNLSVLDGWWAEGHDGTNGWGIDGGVDPDHGHQDHEHAQALLDILEKDVLPTFHDRDEDGVPQRWVQMMRSSLASLAWRFSARRMMEDYAGNIYPGQ